MSFVCMNEFITKLFRWAPTMSFSAFYECLLNKIVIVSVCSAKYSAGVCALANSQKTP